MNKTTKYAGTQTEKNLMAAFAGESDARNLVIWLIGFVAYRLLMGVDTPVGYTLPDMVLTILLCVIAEKLKPSVKQS